VLSREVSLLLSAPLDPSRVSKREGGGGRKLSYLEGHDVIRTANRIFGLGEWGYRTMELRCVGSEEAERNGKVGARVGYTAKVEVWVNGSDGNTAAVFSDVGYGDAVDYNSTITPHELASKEAVTDGVKRCLKNFGDQFGLALYEKGAPEHEGVKRDELTVLKNTLIEEAQRMGVQMVPEKIAEAFGLEVDELQDANAIRGALLKEWDDGE
jgi:DNA recombination protein Rad52